MSHPTHTLIPFVVACLLLCASGERIATAQTVADDTVNPPRKRSAQQNERINELLLLSESSKQVPTTDVSYTFGAGHHNEDYGTSLSDLESKVGTLWNDIPIWQPYLEGSFRGGGITERGELDLFLPLMWSDSTLLFADLRGSIGDTGNHEGNWSVAARTLTSSDWILGAWGGYDLRESSTGNHFDQVSFGIEAMNLDWDFRMNGYVPTNMDPQRVPGIPTAVFTGNNIVVRSNQESAFGGLDG